MSDDGLTPSARIACSAVRSDLIHRGAELVGLAERFSSRVFARAVALTGLAALAALVLLPVRTLPPGAPVTAAYVATGLIVLLAPLALAHVGRLHRALLRRNGLQLGFVLVAAALVVHPELSGELWWPSCAILMTLAIVVSLRRTLVYCLLVLIAATIGRAVIGDLDDAGTVAIVGLWIGIPMWTLAFAVTTERLTAQVLRLRASSLDDSPREPPRRFKAESLATPIAADPVDAGRRADTPTTDEDVSATGDAREARTSQLNARRLDPATGDARETRTSQLNARQLDPATGDARETRTSRLNARQLEVVLLLADGHRYDEIAACLSLSKRHVQRLAADAVARLEVRNVNELVAVAVSEGIAPPVDHPASAD